MKVHGPPQAASPAMSLSKKRGDDEVGELLSSAANREVFEFYGTLTLALALALDGGVVAFNGHHGRSGCMYLFAAYASIIAFGMYFVRTYTKRPDSFKMANLLLHLPIFLGLIGMFFWGAVQSFIA